MKELEELGIIVKENEPMSKHTTLAIGGPAEFFAEPTTGDEFAQAVNYAREKELETTIIGLGANMLISDEGIKGLVIRPQLKKIIHELILPSKQPVLYLLFL